MLLSKGKGWLRSVLKFFLGLIVGVILVIVVGVIALFAIASSRSKAPVIAGGSTLLLHLDGSIPERAPFEIPLGAFGQRTPLTIHEVWSVLRKAAADSRIKAVVIEPSNLQIGWGKMEELHSELLRFRKSGKPLYAYLKTPGTREYFVATAASKIYIAPEDQLNFKGLRLELMYFKRTLDKLGVSFDVLHDGKYKDYGDMYTRSEMSPETREVLTSVIDRLYANLLKTVGVARRKSATEVQDAIDNGPLLAKQAVDRGLIDELCYEDEMFGKLRKDLKADIHKVGEREYAHSPDSDAGINTTQSIGFVVAEGEIVRGSPDSESSTDGIESESFDKLLAKVGDDANLKGVIVRIDSPGGEAFASDTIWKSMNQLAKKKPVVISMSDYAASGGYYMAMSGSPVVAYPGTLTGSIGVVYAKPNLRGLYDKIGVDPNTLSRGRFAQIDSLDAPLTGAEKAKVQEGIDANYHSFVQKVADSRKRSYDQIEPLAQGRVWLGEQAKENGLVDSLGGIDQAIDLLKQKASIAPSQVVNLVVYPARRSLLDLLFSSQTADSEVEEKLAMALRLRSGGWIPAPVQSLIRSPQVQVWMRGGYLSVFPYSLSVN